MNCLKMFSLLTVVSSPNSKISKFRTNVLPLKVCASFPLTFVVNCSQESGPTW